MTAILLCAIAFALAPATPARATIRYEISLAHPAQHQFHVTMTVPAAQGGVVLQMPAWNALYEIRDFAYRVTGLHAEDASGNSLPVRRVDKQTWRIEVSAGGPSGGQSRAASADIRIEYASYWDDPGPFDTQLDDEHAFLNLAMVLCYLPERRGEDAVVRFSDIPESWRVAIELPQSKELPQNTGAESGTAAYQAANYDALVDAPVEIGRFDEWTFAGGGAAAGRTIRVVYHGEGVDHALLTRMLSEIVSYETRLMGNAPFPEYTFFLHVGRNYGGGGMEHANCTAIAVDNFAELASVSAHEFFHLWNVKRIRPQSLEPVDYTHEMWTRALWFAEGVTSTYAAYTLVRTGLWSHAQFLADLGEQISELEARPARTWQSAEESSLDTWFDRYTLYDRPDFSISYYNKGQLLGVALDILIRDATDNRASLDDVLRRMNQQYAERGRFYDDSAGVERAVEETVREAQPGSAPNPPPRGEPNAELNAQLNTGPRAGSTSAVPAAQSGSASGVEPGAGPDAGPRAGSTDFADFFKRYVGGTDEMPFADLLARAGLALRSVGQNRAAPGQEASQIYSVEEMPNATERQRRIRNDIFLGTTDAATGRAAAGKAAAP